ncbi:hypothetical protein [Peribacillus sp. SCS-155]
MLLIIVGCACPNYENV